MKVRIKFAKLGEMRFIGHLDLMRFFQKAIRRAGLDIRYSEGLSPHMIMSFASPLGIGLTSTGGYVDIELSTPVTTKEGLERLNAVTAAGIDFLDLRQIEEGKGAKAMSLVAAADYEVRLRAGYPAPKDWQEELKGFLAQRELLIEKESKKAAKKAAAKRGAGPDRDGGHGTLPKLGDYGTAAGAGDGGASKEYEAPAVKALDIRPLIYEADAREGYIFMKLAAGSLANLKPETVVCSWYDRMGLPFSPSMLALHRCELYARTGEGGFVSLNELGSVI